MEQVKKGPWHDARVTLPYTLPVCAGYASVSIAFGVLMNAAGFAPWWTVLMSLVIYAGSMQFLAVSLLAAPFAPLEALVLAVMVNARHVFYGLAMLEPYRKTGRLRWFLTFGLTDEVFSLVSTLDTPEGMEDRSFYFWLTAISYFYWVAGSAVGALVGDLIPFDTTGLDFALTALFVVLFLEQWKRRENRPAGVVGLVCAGVSLAAVGAENMVLCAMGLILLVLLGGRKYL